MKMLLDLSLQGFTRDRVEQESQKGGNLSGSSRCGSESHTWEIEPLPVGLAVPFVVETGWHQTREGLEC